VNPAIKLELKKAVNPAINGIKKSGVSSHEIGT